MENYEQVKVDFVIEDYAAGCLIENIEILEQDEEATPEAASAKVFAAEMVKAMQALTAGVVTQHADAPKADAHTDGEEA
ncbi:hypothetical protein SK44_03507 [Klebsiella aerogenes]|nr:hypothetical protein SK43_03338 [Klebsiella aerogenes]KLW15721.1 hypothetical protein SK44_03507 [Klebsiella aerogenes]